MGDQTITSLTAYLEVATVASSCRISKRCRGRARIASDAWARPEMSLLRPPRHLSNGMVYLHRSDASWDDCIIERNGWIARTKEVGLYMENDDHFLLPDGRSDLAEFYRESKQHIDAFVRAEGSLAGKLCVDLGASIGWVEVYLLRAQPAAQIVALEVNDDPLCGLGRASALRERAGADFASLVADMHHIPLHDNSVDVVFSVDALHHFRDLNEVFAEAHRILKPGGRFYGLNEPDRPPHVDERGLVAEFAAIELRHGIIERRPTYDEYVAAGSILGLRSINNEMSIVQHVDTASLLLKSEKIYRAGLPRPACRSFGS